MEKYESMIEMPKESKDKKNKTYSSPKIKERNFTPSITTILLTMLLCLIFYYSTQNIIYDLYKGPNDNDKFMIQNNKTKTEISEKNKNVKEIKEEKEKQKEKEEEKEEEEEEEEEKNQR